MSLFDFFFPEQAQATHLRQLISEQRQSRMRRARDARRGDAVGERVAALEHDVGYLALILGAVAERLSEKGVVTRQELKDAIAALDDVDGIKDGRLDVNVIRGRLG